MDDDELQKVMGFSGFGGKVLVHVSLLPAPSSLGQCWSIIVYKFIN